MAIYDDGILIKNSACLVNSHFSFDSISFSCFHDILVEVVENLVGDGIVHVSSSDGERVSICLVVGDISHCPRCEETEGEQGDCGG